MRVVLIAENDDPAAWRRALAGRVEGLELLAWEDCDEPQTVDAALVWQPPPGALARLPALKLIQNLGMGVDALFAPGVLPDFEVPLARLVDRDLIGQMSEYVCWAVLHYHRRIEPYRQQQRRRVWRQLPATDAGACPVAVLGLGEIGADCAAKLAALGFPVRGWSRSPRRIGGVRCYHAEQGLRDCVAGSRVLVCLLPLTAATAGLIDAELLAALAPGGCVVNVARGAHVVDRDLLAALDDGRLERAVLDVFDDEPLPPDSRYWTHPKVLVTPHIAGLTRPETAAAQVAENLCRVASGQAARHLIDLQRGY